MAHGTLDDELAAIARRIDEIATADTRQLENLRIALLGRKSGALTAILRSLVELPTGERDRIGTKANQLKARIKDALNARLRELKPGIYEDLPVASVRAKAQELPEVRLKPDLTLPGRATWRGALHPITQAVDEICDIFRELGFVRVVGTEAELEAYNFTKLNIPLDHPAADEHDTFYLGPGIVLRTHTSPMQARILERYPPPIRIVVPGLCYRRDPFDPSHAPAFDQIEGLVVDEGVSFVDFKAGIDFFVRRFFGPSTKVRFRPSFFPFTEPSAEVDAECQVCRGTGCPTCKQTGWMEIMGAGMVHPAVFEANGVDSERYTGYAFGMGPGRIAMVRHGIPDIRLHFQNDMRFLDQFAE